LVLAKLSDAKGVSPEELAAMTTANALRMFDRVTHLTH
jgi:Tat protein secretion system quality control protein TatD with DNase activity